MRALECHETFKADKKTFLRVFTANMLLTIATFAVIFYQYRNIFGDLSIAAIVARMDYAVMAGAQLTITYIFVTFLWCSRKRFAKINDHLRFGVNDLF